MLAVAALQLSVLQLTLMMSRGDKPTEPLIAGRRHRLNRPPPCQRPSLSSTPAVAEPESAPTASTTPPLVVDSPKAVTVKRAGSGAGEDDRRAGQVVPGQCC